MATQTTYSKRNIITKLDDLGLYSDMIRRDGESITNFRSRLLRAQAMPGGPNSNRLTDSIGSELGLGQAYLILVTATEDLVNLEITDTQCLVSLSGVNQTTINLVDLDPDGAWVFLTISGLVSGLTGVSGISPAAVSGYEALPAILLEPQSSYIQVINEQVPRLQSYNLGIQSAGEAPAGAIILDSVSFNDTNTYQTQVDTPSKHGEWSVNTSGRVNVFDVPPDLILATYKFNLLTSGQTMGLVGNGVRVFNLALEEVQEKLFTTSGITQQANDILFDIRNIDRNFWGN